MILPLPPVSRGPSHPPPVDFTAPDRMSGAPIVAKIVDAGPNDEDDFTTNTYWIKFQRATWNKTTRAVEFEDDTSACLGVVDRAVNIAESSDSHTLPTIGICYVTLWRVVEPSNPPIFTWVFSRGPMIVPIMIDTFVRDGTEQRWFYSWHVPQKPLTGYPTNIGPDTDAWSHVVQAVAGPSSNYGYAYNGCETINTGVSGPTHYGNGILVADLPTGLSMQPITPYTIHFAMLITPADGGPIEAWFSSPNGLTGAVDCP